MTDATIYVVAMRLEGDMEQRKEILDAVMNDDWYSSEMGALATMDQWNAHFLEQLTDEQYESGDFTLLGVFNLEFTKLANPHDH